MHSRFTKEEVKKYRTILLRLRMRLASDLSATEKDALSRTIGEASTIDISDFADLGADNYEQDLSLGLMEDKQEAIREIDDALARIADQSFGICEGCSAVIPKSRLDAIPYARYCVECQRKEEEEKASGAK